MQPPQSDPVAVNSQERFPVRIDAPDLCGRFSGRVLRGLDARAATPAWMKRRLEHSGQRSISALVDISNYVMLEVGQPSHVFDLHKVRGGLQVRWGRAGEKITLLNEQTVEIDTQVGVVADDSGAEAIAGIMGGLSTSVSLDTTDVYLEAAFWWPEAIQGRPRRYNFSTEAAHRFERGVDFARTVAALERLTQLIVQICGTNKTRIGPIDDTVVHLPRRDPVDLRWERLQRVEVDLIEEVGRVYGYARIPAEAPFARARMRTRSEGRRRAHDLRLAMARAGYQELLNFSFVPESWESEFGADASRSIRVLNPIAAQYSVMRSNLLAGLVANLRYNLNRQASRVRTFEIASVFARDPHGADGAEQVAGIAQPCHLAALAFGPAEEEQWGLPQRAVDFFDVKGDLERLMFPLEARFSTMGNLTGGAAMHAALRPGRCAAVVLNGDTIGWIGELHPRLCKSFDLPAAPVVFEVQISPLLQIGTPAPQPVPRFPALVRDIAVWIDSAVPAGEVLEDLRALASSKSSLAAVRAVRLFDVFRPSPDSAGDASAERASGLLIKEKSLAFRIVLQDTQRSLAEVDADAARAAIAEHLLQRWGARVRQ
ncbi:Phenylalanine--tRNA ligase beta subunit (fragment) [Burkholderiales bacterium]